MKTELLVSVFCYPICTYKKRSFCYLICESCEVCAITLSLCLVLNE